MPDAREQDTNEDADGEDATEEEPARAGGGGSTVRTLVTGAVVAAVAGAAAVAGRKLVAALRERGSGDQPSANGAGAVDDDDLVSVLRKTALEVALAAASAATGYLSHEDARAEEDDSED